MKGNELKEAEAAFLKRPSRSREAVTLAHLGFKGRALTRRQMTQLARSSDPSKLLKEIADGHAVRQRPALPRQEP